MTNLSPMKNTRTEKRKSSGLDSSHTQKMTKLERKQARLNKRLTRGLGA